MKKFFCYAAFLLVVLSGVRLSGQSYRNFREEYDNIKERARLRLGPLRVIPVFRLSEVGRDSNVYFREEGGEVIPDFTATLSPEARGYWLVGSSVIVSVTENPEYLFYAKEKELRAFTNSFSTGLRLLVLRSFSLAADYHILSHVRRATSELDRRIRDTATGAGAGFFFETPRGTAVGFTGSIEDFRYKDVASDAPDDIYATSLDRRETAAAFDLYYRVFSQSFFFTTVGWTRYEFVFPESAWRDARSLEVSGGFRFPFLGRARGMISLGWKSFKPDSAERKPFSGLVAATDVSLRFGRLGINLGYARDNAFSYNESAYYYVDGRARAGLSFYVAPFLRIDGNLQFGTMAYPEPQEVWYGGEVFVIDRREDVNRTFSVGPVVRVVGTVGLGLTYNFYKRTSNAPGFNVRRNFVGAFLTYEF
ncbi:MAG: outer membrane beta-barrel protein [Candidatus Aminicenantes bacterium]|nr:outer membrane beta-barrel protein [Candidatus Aminicenantes bacterium]